MSRFAPSAFAAIALSVFATSAQSQQQPYAGHESRTIKALSDQQISDLKAGRGMGLALPAELNGYPGPVHLLELADSLALSDDQRATIEGLVSAMKAETIPLGERLIEEESELDRQFAGHTITEAILASSTQAIGGTQAALRAAHLKYHLSTVRLLTPDQVQRYGELRGYRGAADTDAPHAGHRTPH